MWRIFLSVSMVRWSNFDLFWCFWSLDKACSFFTLDLQRTYFLIYSSFLVLFVILCCFLETSLIEFFIRSLFFRLGALISLNFFIRTNRWVGNMIVFEYPFIAIAIRIKILMNPQAQLLVSRLIMIRFEKFICLYIHVNHHFHDFLINVNYLLASQWINLLVSLQINHEATKCINQV